MTSWSSLPAEMKSEVLKYTNFLTCNNVRLCSQADKEAVESMKAKVPFLKIGISLEAVNLLIIQNPNEILRIDLIAEENKIYRSQNLDIGKDSTIMKSDSFLEEISNFLNGIFQRKLEIESCLIENKDVPTHHEMLKFIEKKLSATCPKRLVLSGKFFSNTHKSLPFLKKEKKPEVLIRNWKKDISKRWEGYSLPIIKIYEVSKWKSKYGNQEDIIAWTALELVTYIARIASNPIYRTHWLPGYHVENNERSLSSYGGTFEQFPNYDTYKLRMDSKKINFVKFTECGISMQVGSPQNIDMKDSTCSLEFMCPRCANHSMEDWYFREIIGNLH
ncbi:hypothetical protein GCK72_006595 [Caenorhabditis remanei]|uniref:F-box domain-containing protein n=1 Tax=Caenorhabditis remanei TaxID=31234 RepID=A0A6A5HJ58_CAERE|nr:hypothetical protein GCK72_006595 [Caenorhabditis remanei]KAF1766637.1 hypothetical protein GCK72_006595 [Caenorhabditis remanei]